MKTIWALARWNRKKIHFGELNWEGKIITINNEETGKLAQKIYDSITGIQSSKIEDNFGWTVDVK